MRARFWAEALLALAACAPAPTAPPPVVEMPVASTQLDASVPVEEPPRVVMRPSRDVAIDPAPPGAFAGASGNVPGDSGITSLAASGDLVIAAGNGFLLRSTDRGLHFLRSDRAIRFPVVAFASPDEVFVGGAHGILRSSDGGVTFALVGTPPGPPSGILASGPEVWVVGGGTPPFVARSADHGATFTPVSTPIPDGWFHAVATTNGKDVVVVGSEHVSGGRNDVVLRSTNAGQSWTRLAPFSSLSNGQSRVVCAASGTLFAGSTYELYLTRDLGKTWKLATP